MNLPRLQVVTDETVQSRYSHVELAELALAGGADAVQFREKRNWTTAALIGVAARIVQACRSASALAIIDDRADVALAVAAGGLHIGRDDLDATTARRIVGVDAVVGGTANSYDEAMAVAATEVDYLGVGPVYGTRSKANPAPVMGLDTLARIAAACPKPVVAIGGITAARIPEVLQTGAHGVAVLSDVVAAARPEEAAAACRMAVGAALGTPQSPWQSP
jgi:thiamine-phosphate pyrophosphorylase